MQNVQKEEEEEEDDPVERVVDGEKRHVGRQGELIPRDHGRKGVQKWGSTFAEGC
jgi:hypothetical protein